MSISNINTVTTTKSKRISANLLQVGQWKLSRTLGKLCNTFTDTLALAKAMLTALLPVTKVKLLKFY